MRLASPTANWSTASIGEPKLSQAQQPCSSIREVTLTVTNNAATTVGLPLGIGSVFLVDSDGRWYGADVAIINGTIDGSYRLEPKQTKQITIPFPNTFGVKDRPVAIMIADRGTWRALALTIAPATVPTVPPTLSPLQTDLFQQVADLDVSPDTWYVRLPALNPDRAVLETFSVTAFEMRFSYLWQNQRVTVVGTPNADATAFDFTWKQHDQTADPNSAPNFSGKGILTLRVASGTTTMAGRWWGPGDDEGSAAYRGNIELLPNP